VPPSDPYSLSDGQVKSLEAGSRAQFAAWYTYTAMIWCMKFCMLFFYKRLTFGTMQHRTVNWLMWVCGVTYIAVLLTISLSCQP
jgi:threonine/homoserine/homoserine lactone efflux protein